METDNITQPNLPAKGPELRLKRSLGKGKKSVVIKCASGGITILTDQMGTTLPAYTDCLQGKASKQTVVLEYDGKIDNRSSIKLVGFDEELPELSIPQYLLVSGVDHDLIDGLIDEFELRNHLFLLCSQLTKTVARQVQLLAAVGSGASVVILNDPFQPFSGRWREVFGEYLFDDCVRTNRVYVCTNLSFIPNSWMGKPNVSSYDVGIIFEKAKLRESDPEKAAMKEAVKRHNVNELNEKYYKQPYKISVPIPDSVINASNSIQEVIVRNLANIGTFLREWTSPIFFAAFAVITVIAGIMLSYDVGGSREKLQSVIQKISFQNEENKKNPPPVNLGKKQPQQNTSDSEQNPTDLEQNEEETAIEENIIEEQETTEAEIELAPNIESLRLIFNSLGIEWKNSYMSLMPATNINDQMTNDVSD